MADAPQYIAERLRPRRDWYSRRAVSAKRLHLALQYGGMAASILLVLLIHFESISRPALAILAALVSLCLAADRIGRFGELWWTYRLAAEALATEEQMFHHHVGPYSGNSSPEDLLVMRCEAILSREADVWKGIVQDRASGASKAE